MIAVDGTYKVKANTLVVTLQGKTETDKIIKLTDTELIIEDDKGKVDEYKRASANQPNNEWVKIADKVAKFEVELPSKPKETLNKTGKQLVVEREGGKVALFIAVTDLPKQIDTGDAPAVKLILDNGQAAAIKGFKGGKLLSEQDFKFGLKHPARDLDIQIPNLGTYRQRMILTPTRFYVVVAMGPEDYLKGAEAKKFMQSFKVTD